MLVWGTAMRQANTRHASITFGVTLLLATTVVVLASSSLEAGAAALGANGPCTSSSFTIPHPTTSTESVTVFEPQGGNDCGGRRPVVFFAHGYTARTPARTPRSSNIW